MLSDTESSESRLPLLVLRGGSEHEPAKETTVIKIEVMEVEVF
jgi:hypothetical protein